MATYVSFDIGGTSIKYGLVADSGQLLAHGAFATVNDRQALTAHLNQIVATYQYDHKLTGIGVSVPGIVVATTAKTGGAITSLAGYDFKQCFDRWHLPIHVTNDANAAALAESWCGNAQGCRNYVCFVLGTGIGAGIIVNGQLVNGAHGYAGEFGWQLLAGISQPDDLEADSLTFSASVVNGFVRQYNEAHQPAAPEQDATAIITAKAVDPVARQAWHDFVQAVALMLINTIATLDPERILIGGGISANPVFMQALTAKVTTLLTHHHSLAHQEPPRIMPALLGNDAGLLGAIQPFI
ncbi:ROK family protein [Lacticaseibacillus sp. GG6-2]